MSSDNRSENSPLLPRFISTSYFSGPKLFALICALTLSVGSHYAAHSLSALKATVKEELNISNTEYGVLQSSVSIVNTILPFFGGVFIDKFGTTKGAFLTTSLITLGTFFVALSTHLVSFKVMVLGRVLYGLGSGSIVIIQEAILTHWFNGKGLALTLGLQIAISRLSSFLSLATAIPISNFFGFYGFAFWASTVLCVLSWIMNLLYIRLLKKNRTRDDQQELLAIQEKKTFKMFHVFLFPQLYWLIILQGFILGSLWTTFIHINSEFIQLRFGSSDEAAAFNASLTQFFPIFFVPFLGLLLERYGKRLSTVLFCGFCFTLCIALLQFTKINPILAIFIFSLSLGSGPVSLLSSIPLLLPITSVGTAYGIHKSATNIGDTIMDIVIGKLQDDKQEHYADPHAYDRVMIFYIFCGLASMIVCCIMLVINRLSWKNLLQLDGRSKNLVREQNQDWYSKAENLIESNTLRRRLHSHLKLKNTLPIILLVSALFAAWVLFFKFLLQTDF